MAACDDEIGVDEKEKSRGRGEQPVGVERDRASMAACRADHEQSEAMREAHKREKRRKQRRGADPLAENVVKAASTRRQKMAEVGR